MTRKNKISEFLNTNKCFSGLTESQKVQMNLFLQLIKVTDSDIGSKRYLVMGWKRRRDI